MRKILCLFLLFSSVFLSGADVQPMFYCGFENQEEFDGLAGICNVSLKFVDGLKGKALDLGRDSCSFPVAKTVPTPEGTLSVWISPIWKLRSKDSPRCQIFSVSNQKNSEEAVHLFDYLCLLGSSYGEPEKGVPFQLFCLVRKTKSEQGLLKIPDASWEPGHWQHIGITWRINTDKKDGEFIFYLNGKQIGRETDFRALRIELGERLACVPQGVIDEMKVWNKILSPEDLAREYEQCSSLLKVGTK